MPDKLFGIPKEINTGITVIKAKNFKSKADSNK